MGRCNLFVLWAVVLAFSLPAVANGQGIDPLGDQAPLEATITLGRDPEPPDCARPEDSVSMNWLITHSTTPDFVYYKLMDPNGDTVEDQTYPGSTGLDVNRQWDVPITPIIGKYWIRVEFHSLEAGHESTAEVSFYVCLGVGRICVQKMEDLDCDNQPTMADGPVPGWWMCIDTPWGDTFCQETNANGVACWENLPRGDYRAYELLPFPPGWSPIGPISYDLSITDANPEWSDLFFNVYVEQCGACCLCDGTCLEWVTRDICSQDPMAIFHGGFHCDEVVCGAPSATEETTWGTLKENYR